MIDSKELLENYDKYKLKYTAFCKDVQDIMINNLDKMSVEYHSINFRVKELESTRNKIKNKGYINGLSDICDFGGLRIITFTRVEVTAIKDFIYNEFQVDEKNSNDKREEFNEDQFGYLSLHLVVEMNNSRLSLPENKSYVGMKIEIQIRTLLEHSWASLSHDNVYKFNKNLPKKLVRKLNATSAMLEMIDDQFSDIINEIETYKSSSVKEINDNNDIVLDSVTLIPYLTSRFEKYKLNDTNLNKMVDTLLYELNNYGIITSYEFDDLLNKIGDKIDSIVEFSNYYIGLVRDLMIINNASKYFNLAWNNHWHGVGRKTLDFWAKFGVKNSDLPDTLDYNPYWDD